MPTPRSPDTVARDAEACSLRAEGWTYQRIADHLGVTRQSAWEMVQRAMAEIITEPAETARQFEMDRLDNLESQVRDAMAAGKLKVGDGADRLLRIFESRRKLLGLDAASKLDIGGGVTYEVIGVPDSAL